MDTIIYVIIGIFVLMYIIDKKEIVKVDSEIIDEVIDDKTGKTVKHHQKSIQNRVTPIKIHKKTKKLVKPGGKIKTNQQKTG